MFSIVIASTEASILGLGERHPQNEDELEDVVEGCFHELAKAPKIGRKYHIA
jgi:hypothetical protein